MAAICNLQRCPSSREQRCFACPKGGLDVPVVCDYCDEMGNCTASESCAARAAIAASNAAAPVEWGV